MEKKNNFSSAEEYNNWITFYLNYLNPYFSEENFSLFQKKWQSYWKLFHFWKEKKLDNEEIKTVVKELIETKKSFAFLVKKYEKKVNIDEKLIKDELKSLWNDELTKMAAANCQKVQNYLLGKVRKKFSDYPLMPIILIIQNFLEEKIVR